MYLDTDIYTQLTSFTFGATIHCAVEILLNIIIKKRRYKNEEWTQAGKDLSDEDPAAFETPKVKSRRVATVYF